MLSQALPLIGWGAAAVGILFLILWLIHLPLKNAGIVDVGWGPGFVILTAIFVSMGAGWTLRNTVLFLMVAVWGVRIAAFLIKRIRREGHEDRRYQKLRQEWGPHIAMKFLAFFEFQAVLQIILSLPFVLTALNPRPYLHPVEILAVGLFVISLIGETIADEQLLAFKSDPANKGKTCDTGLWNYSRHPNYFFEWLIWVSFALYNLPTPLGWLSPSSPLLMYILMMHFSGIPLSEEQALKTRGEAYRRYQQTTSAFFLRPKRMI